MIKKFTILGERCSGTNFARVTISENLNLDITWEYGWKHYFGKNNFNNSDDTLFMGIIRNPIDWLDSFYKNPHEIPDENKPLYNFLLNKFYNKSIENYNVFQTDLQNEYSNIFEMRKLKNNFLMNKMQTLVKNYILISYEELTSNTEKVLNNIKDKFNLTFKKSTIEKITYYKIFKDIPFVRKPVTLSDDIIQFIKHNLDSEQEEKLGYKIFE